MLPAVADLRVLDLGCGFGWFARWADRQGAASVLGLDLSERMLERARRDTDDDRVTYRRQDLETLAGYVTALLRAGFAVTALKEWGPTPEQVAEHLEWAPERERPLFLLVRADRLAA